MSDEMTPAELARAELAAVLREYESDRRCSHGYLRDERVWECVIEDVNDVLRDFAYDVSKVPADRDWIPSAYIQLVEHLANFHPDATRDVIEIFKGVLAERKADPEGSE